MTALDTGATSIVDSITSAFGTIATDCTNAVTAVLPIALPVMGAIIVVGIGMKIFKKVTKA